MDKRQTSWTPERREAHSIAMRKMWADKQKAANYESAKIKTPVKNWLQKIYAMIK